MAVWLSICGNFRVKVDASSAYFLSYSAVFTPPSNSVLRYAHTEDTVFIVCRIASRYTHAVDDDLKQQKLNTLVGAAIRALVESGADDAFIGAFAASHRKHVAEVLGTTETLPQAPELLSIVKQAVSEALGNSKSLQETPRKRRLNVLINGRRTSITINLSTEKQLIDAHGSSATTVIQDIASKVPSDVSNKSKWVEERLQAVLAFREQQTTTHPH